MKNIKLTCENKMVKPTIENSKERQNTNLVIPDNKGKQKWLDKTELLENNKKKLIRSLTQPNAKHTWKGLKQLNSFKPCLADVYKYAFMGLGPYRFACLDKARETRKQAHEILTLRHSCRHNDVDVLMGCWLAQGQILLSKAVPLFL